MSNLSPVSVDEMMVATVLENLAEPVPAIVIEPLPFSESASEEDLDFATTPLPRKKNTKAALPTPPVDSPLPGVSFARSDRSYPLEQAKKEMETAITAVRALASARRQVDDTAFKRPINPTMAAKLGPVTLKGKPRKDKSQSQVRMLYDRVEEVLLVTQRAIAMTEAAGLKDFRPFSANCWTKVFPDVRLGHKTRVEKVALMLWIHKKLPIPEDYVPQVVKRTRDFVEELDPEILDIMGRYTGINARVRSIGK